MAVGRVPEGGDVQRSAGDDPARSWCLWHRRDRHRLPPLEFNVNDQNAPLECRHTAGHRAIAKTAICAQAPSRPAGRAGPGAPNAAAALGWACAVEAKRRALHGAEHRSSINRVMAGASAVVQIVVMFRARTRTCCSPRSWSRSAAAFGPASHPVRVAVHGQIFPDEPDQIVRTIWF